MRKSQRNIVFGLYAAASIACADDGPLDPQNQISPFMTPESYDIASEELYNQLLEFADAGIENGQSVFLCGEGRGNNAEQRLERLVSPTDGSCGGNTISLIISGGGTRQGGNLPLPLFEFGVLQNSPTNINIMAGEAVFVNEATGDTTRKTAVVPYTKRSPTTICTYDGMTVEGEPVHPHPFFRDLCITARQAGLAKASENYIEWFVQEKRGKITSAKNEKLYPER